MKRTALFALLAVLLLSITARAAELPALPDGVLPDGLAEAAARDGILHGGAAWLAETARTALYNVVGAGMRSAALLVLVALICGAAEGMTGGGEAARYVPFCGVLATAALAAGDLQSLIGLGARTVDGLGTLAKLLLPAIAASMAAGGLVSTASVWQVTTLMICDLLSAAVSQLLLPLVYCCLAAAAAGAALGEEGLGTLADGIKRLVTTGLKLVTAAFSAYLAVSGVLTGSADRTAVRATKAAVSGAIPVVGGMLADAAESVLAAAGMLRGAIGALGVFAVGAVCLTPLLRLGVQFLLYKLAAFAAGLVGTKALAGFLNRLGEAFALVFAMTAASALMLLAAILVAVTMAVG